MTSRSHPNALETARWGPRWADTRSVTAPAGAGARCERPASREPAKDCVRDTAIAKMELRVLGWLTSISLSRCARPRPLYGSSQRVHNSLLEPYSRPVEDPATIRQPVSAKSGRMVIMGLPNRRPSILLETHV